MSYIEQMTDKNSTDLNLMHGINYFPNQGNQGFEHSSSECVLIIPNINWALLSGMCKN